MNKKLKATTLILGMALSAGSYAEDGLRVHEWGTFTSFFGANGQKLEGMHHEDEPLPSFVYGYNNLSVPDLDIISPPTFSKAPAELINPRREIFPHNPINVGITQKMETPVIYFYGKEGQQIDLSVDFPKGIHSQFYPRPSSFSPAVGEVETLGPSQIQYNLKLLSPDAGELPTTVSHSIWNPAREVPKANVIDVNGEREKFIFYRGVGDFEGSLTVSSPRRSNEIVLTNLSDRPHAAVFILNVEEDKAIIKRVTPALGAQNVAVPKASMAKAEYLPMAKEMVKDALVEAGLFEDEAKGLVNTWEKSYFKQDGPRILYLLHAEDVERILPMKVSPKPDHLTRVLVGRLEFMTKNQERKLLNDIVAKELDLSGDRFAEPKLRRLEMLIQESSQLNEQEKQSLNSEVQRRILNARFF